MWQLVVVQLAPLLVMPDIIILAANVFVTEVGQLGQGGVLVRPMVGVAVIQPIIRRQGHVHAIIRHRIMVEHLVPWMLEPHAQQSAVVAA